MKTTEQWFGELIPEVSTLALDNVKKLGAEGALNYPEPSLHQALAGAFIWHDTDQDKGFWAAIHTSALILDKGLIDSKTFVKEQEEAVEKYLKRGIDTE